MSAPAQIRICSCGVEFRVFSYNSQRNRHPVWHCECPACETSSQRVVATIALTLQGTDIGLLLARIARTDLT